jgi:glycosyltransferase involved in cell wall biosynthesis
VKILHLLSDLNIGGGPMHVLTLALGLRAHGVESIVAGPDGPMRRHFEMAGIRTVVGSLVREQGADLVHVHGKRGALAAVCTALPVVRTFHGLHYERYGPVKRRLYFALERWLARRTAAVIHLTEAQRAEALRLGLPGGHVIPNGIDVDGTAARALPRALARRILDLPEKAYVLGTVARLDPVKHLDTLTAAHAEMPSDAHLCVIGGGDIPRDIVRRGRACGVHFVGPLPDAARLLRAFDVYVSASSREGLPLAVLEAMAVGLPCLLSDIPAHEALVGRSPQLTRNVVTSLAWLRKWPELAAQYGADNQRYVRTTHDAATMVGRTVMVYCDAVGRSRWDLALEPARRRAHQAPAVTSLVAGAPSFVKTDANGTRHEYRLCSGPTAAYHAWWERLPSRERR